MVSDVATQQIQLGEKLTSKGECMSQRRRLRVLQHVRYKDGGDAPVDIRRSFSYSTLLIIYAKVVGELSNQFFQVNQRKHTDYSTSIFNLTTREENSLRVAKIRRDMLGYDDVSSGVTYMTEGRFGCVYKPVWLCWSVPKEPLKKTLFLSVLLILVHLRPQPTGLVHFSKSLPSSSLARYTCLRISVQKRIRT